VPTQAGWDVFPVVVALLQWGDRHRTGPNGPSWLVTHRDCGHAVSVDVACRGHPGQSLDHRQTRPQRSPENVNPTTQQQDNKQSAIALRPSP
jgi:hypothetical protein